ncbi:hypothetical protein JDV09_11790 [Mycobacterium sp. Y57]|uniref:hypothetical protein n=1 Tax=Mycolicibacterium xanthum TaxID=2796469 RepID=UPI001C840EFB|nr:hypothetical protein [Mycolicibacterium xanthum]MBX7432781.1 hypothetical protein [Mycolicibacterium xanthum]
MDSTTRPSHAAAPVETTGHGAFSPAGVSWASGFGSPIAGGTLLALDYWNWDKKAEAGFGFAAVILATIMIAGALTFLMPVDIWPLGIWYVVVFGAYAGIGHLVAEYYQGTQFEAHLAAGGQKIADWVSAGLGVGFAIPLIYVYSLG